MWRLASSVTLCGRRCSCVENVMRGWGGHQLEQCQCMRTASGHTKLWPWTGACVITENEDFV